MFLVEQRMVAGAVFAVVVVVVAVESEHVVVAVAGVAAAGMHPAEAYSD